MFEAVIFYVSLNLSSILQLPNLAEFSDTAPLNKVVNEAHKPSLAVSVFSVSMGVFSVMVLY